MNKHDIFRDNGQLKVNIAIKADCSMLEMEEQISEILDSMKEELSDLERLLVHKQILEAFNSEKRQKN